MANDEKDIRSQEGPINPEFGAEAYDPAQTRVDLQVPDGLSVQATEDWVAGDKERAKAALKAEEGKGDDARSTLVSKLEALANDEVGGIAQGQPAGPAVTPGAEGTV